MYYLNEIISVPCSCVYSVSFILYDVIIHILIGLSVESEVARKRVHEHIKPIPHVDDAGLGNQDSDRERFCLHNFRFNRKCVFPAIQASVI